MIPRTITSIQLAKVTLAHRQKSCRAKNFLKNIQSSWRHIFSINLHVIKIFKPIILGRNSNKFFFLIKIFNRLLNFLAIKRRYTNKRNFQRFSHSPSIRSKYPQTTTTFNTVALVIDFHCKINIRSLR